MTVGMSVCVCVCVSEREREREQTGFDSKHMETERKQEEMIWPSLEEEEEGSLSLSRRWTAPPTLTIRYHGIVIKICADNTDKLWMHSTFKRDNNWSVCLFSDQQRDFLKEICLKCSGPNKNMQISATKQKFIDEKNKNWKT